MKLYVLGCAGWIPSKNETCCFLIEHKGHLIMLDAGTGVSNIKHYQDILGKYDTLHIILTHYHLDHIIGLSYLLPYVSNKDVIIYGPGIPSYRKSTKKILSEFFQPYFFSRPLEKLAQKLECVDYSKEPIFNIGDIIISVTKQIHSSPSFSIMLDDELLYVTDTIFDAKRWADTHGVKVLLHECWQIHGDDSQQKHCSLESILKNIPLGNFKKILLIHQNPTWNENDIATISESIKDTNISLAKDLEKIEIL